MKVGFIGLGRMGGGMAANIARAGHDVLAWNRSPVDPASLPGVHIAATPADVLDADVAFTMLSDDAAIREVLLDPGLLAHARAGLVHVVSATISVAFAQTLAQAHRDAGVGYVAAPVFGRPDVAAAGKLNVVAAGAPEAIERVRPLLDAIGQRVFVLGEDPRGAAAAKVSGNTMIAMAIEALAEAMAITGAHGVDRAAFLDLMLQTLFGCRAYEVYGAKIVADDFDAGFRLALGLKDLRLASEAAGALSLPMLATVREQMTRAHDAGMADRDWSALADYTLHQHDG